MNSAELKSSMSELKEQLDECTRRAACLEAQTAERTAENASLAAQLGSAQEALAAARQQVHRREGGFLELMA